MPALASDGCSSNLVARVGEPATDGKERGLFCTWTATHPLWHLQDRAPSHHSSSQPHIFRHTAAVHLLEAGVEVNVIRGRIGHADLTTTNRYAENQYEDQAGGTPGQRAFGYYGGMPHQANLENRRIPPELAGVALIVMWPESAAVSGFQLRNPAPSWRRPHNPVGHRSRII